MMRRVFMVFSVELSKALRSPMTYVGPALMALLVLGVSVSQPMARDGMSDYGFIAYATPLALNVVGLILLLTYGAALVSSELASGTLTTTLVRPVLRTDVLLAKILVGWLYACVLAAVAAMLAWGIAYLSGNLTGVVIGGEMIYTGAEMGEAYVMGLLLTLLPMAAAVLYAIMISVVVRGSGTAIGLCLGSWLVIDAVKYPLGFAPFLFSTYLERPWQTFINQCDGLPGSPWTPDAYWVAGTSIAWGLLFFIVSMAVFQRRSLA